MYIPRQNNVNFNYLYYLNLSNNKIKINFKMNYNSMTSRNQMQLNYHQTKVAMMIFYKKINLKTNKANQINA